MNKFAFTSTFSLLNVDHVHLNKSWNYKQVISPFYRLYLIEEGKGTLIGTHETIALESGYLYLIPSFTLCSYACPDHLNQYYLHFLEEAADETSLFVANRKIFKLCAVDTDLICFKRLLALNPERGLLKSTDPEDYEKRPVIDSFQELNNRVPLSVYVETQGIILQLLSRFLDTDYFQPAHLHSVPVKISAAIQYIRTHLSTPLTVELLAEKAKQHPDYFSRLFKEIMGERPLVYIQLKRIERAQFLMITTDSTLNEIADETGFESLAYFSRTFKRLTGQTPSMYRKNNRRV